MGVKKEVHKLTEYYDDHDHEQVVLIYYYQFVVFLTTKNLLVCSK